MSETLHDAAEAYKEKFGDVPTTIGLPDAKVPLAAKLLKEAVEDDEPFSDDKEWWDNLGMEPPPENALT